MIDVNAINVGSRVVFASDVRSPYGGQTMTVNSVLINSYDIDRSIIVLEEDELFNHWYPRAFDKIEPDVSLLDMLTE